VRPMRAVLDARVGVLFALMRRSEATTSGASEVMLALCPSLDSDDYRSQSLIDELRSPLAAYRRMGYFSHRRILCSRPDGSTFVADSHSHADAKVVRLSGFAHMHSRQIVMHWVALWISALHVPFQDRPA